METIRFAKFTEDCFIATLAVAEAEVFADEDGLGLQRFYNIVSDEIGWTETRDFDGERQNEQALGSAVLQQADAVFKSAQHLRRALGRDDGRRMRMEGQHGRSEAVRGRIG